MDKIQQEFKQEAFELIDLAEENLLILENQFNKNSYNELMRCLHSLKGGAGMLELNNVEQTVHRLESFIIDLDLDKTKQIDLSIIEYIFKGIDVVRTLLNDSPAILPEYQKPVKIKEENVSVSTNSTQTHLASKGEFLEKIWIVDDEVDLLDLISMTVMSSGYKVESFTNPRDVLNKLKETSPNLIITDYRMPGMSGLEFVREVNKTNRRMPFILISGFLEVEITLELMKEGVEKIISKPLALDHLLLEVEKVIENHRAIKLLDSSIHLLMYYFSDLNQYLLENNKLSLAKDMKQELKKIFDARNAMKK